MRASLAFVDRANLYLRFGQPVREITLDRWRRITVLAPDARCCRIKWTGNNCSTALWQFMALQVPMPFDHVQRIAGVTPGARIVLRADGEPQGRAALEIIGSIGAAGIEPCAIAATTDARSATVWRHASHCRSTRSSGTPRI